MLQLKPHRRRQSLKELDGFGTGLPSGDDCADAPKIVEMPVIATNAATLE